MANKIKEDDGYVNDGIVPEELDEIAYIPADSDKRLEARHRLEQLREEKELEMLINDDFYNDYSHS